MAEEIRHTDWSRTLLGPSHRWSASLRIAVTTALDSPLPAIVLWGPELAQIYNDAYRPILGLRHPAAMGQATRLCWPEVWQFNQPIYRDVMATGRPLHLEDQVYVIEPNGVPETRYFTVTYAPLRDEIGAVCGVTVIATETTKRVSIERENRALLQATRFAVDQLQSMFEQAPNFIMVLKGSDHTFEIINTAGKSLLSGREMIGKSVQQALPEVADQGFVKILDDVYRSGQTFLASNRLISFAIPGAPSNGARGNPLVDHYVDFVCQPIKDSSGQVTGIFVSGSDVSESHRARLALSDNLRHLQVVEARQAFQLALTDCLRPLADPEDVIAVACEFLGKYLGVSRVVFCDINEAQGTFFARSDWTHVPRASMAGVTNELGDFGVDHIAALRSGHVLANHDVTLDPRTAAHAEAFIQLGIRADLAVPLVKSGVLSAVLALHHAAPRSWTDAEIDVVKDMAERTWSAAESARAQAELRAERDQSQHLFDNMAEGFSVMDRDWRVTQMNTEGLRIGRRTKLEVLGKKLWDIWPEVLGTELEALYRRVMAVRAPETIEQKFDLDNGRAASLTVTVTVYPMLDDSVAAFFRDVTSHNESIEAVRISHLRAESALAVAQLGTFDFNVVTHQVECSIRTLEIFGFEDSQNYLTEDFFGRIVSADLPGFRQEIADATEQNCRLDTGFRIQLPDGSIRNIVSASTCQMDSAGAWVRHVGVVSDATAQKQAEEKLRDVDRHKDEFLAMLAHELRNPLSPITMAADILSRPGIDETTLQEMSAIVRRQTVHMTSLIDDLLDVSRINKGLVTLAREAVDLKDVVANAIEQVRALMEKRNHDFSLQIAGEALYVEGDRVRLIQVFANILTNAAKYTPPGGKITLDLDIVRGLAGNQAKVVVRDNGMGMSESLLPHIFNIFTQGERTPDRYQGGLGLGLPLVKNLVGLLGGTVTARSDGLEKGSEFTVFLPMLIDSPDSGGPSTAMLEAPRSARVMHIVVVDDNVDAATALAMLLEMEGHKVSVAHSAEHALAIARAAALDPPQAFLLDIGLPGMNGYELARQLRAIPVTSAATLIALTGYGQPQDREKSTAAGFDHHLVKPVDPDRLLALLNELRTP